MRKAASMKKLRYLTALLCIVLAAMMLSGCGKTSSQVEAEKQAEIKAANIEDVAAYTQKYFADTMKNSTYETFIQFTDADNNYTVVYRQVRTRHLDEIPREINITPSEFVDALKALNDAYRTVPIPFQELSRPIPMTMKRRSVQRWRQPRAIP